jgi:hypothetical protein
MQFVFRRLLPKEAPAPGNVHPNNSDVLNQEIIEQCFFPFSANTSSIDDNARVSILAENALRTLIKQTLANGDYSAYQSPSLRKAVEKGIKARETKIKREKRRKEVVLMSKEDIMDREWLDASSARLRSLVDLVERRAS